MSLTKLYAARDAMEAHYLCGVLEAEGIQATVMGESLATARGDLPLTAETLPSVWVNEEDARRAVDVIERFSTSSSQEPEVTTSALQGPFFLRWLGFLILALIAFVAIVAGIGMVLTVFAD